MKQIKVKPPPPLLFSISTYEERQRAQQRNNEVDDRDDEPDSVIQVPAPAPSVILQKQATPQFKNHFLSNGKSSPSPPPPPPPETSACFVLNGEISPPIEFADDVPKKTLSATAPATLAKPTPKIDNKSTRLSNGHHRMNGGPVGKQQQRMEKPVTPTPDYDSLIYNSEEIKSIPPPPPPMQNFKKQQSVVGASSKAPAPPKPNRSISVTIGEYDSKKEPAKLGFLSNKSNNYTGGANTSEMLQNELQMTLSRSNLKKAVDPPQKPSKSVLEKTGSENIERLAAMLNSRNSQHVGNQQSINSNGSTKVTISIPKQNTSNLEVKSSPNGILKTTNGGNGLPTGGTAAAGTVIANGGGGGGASASGGSGQVSNGEVKNIKFDNITTVIGIRK